MIFSPQWFTRHQKILLWFANSWIGRRILCINGQKSSVGKNKIIKILPNSITWKGKKKREFVTEFRTHDKFGKRLFYAFKPFWYLCHLWDMTWYPRFNLGFDTLTAYPAAGANSPVDGRMARASVNENFATIRAGAGNWNSVTDEDSQSMWLEATTTSNQYTTLARGIFCFDTSSLSGGTVSSAVFSLYGSNKSNNLGSPTAHVAGATPAATNTLADADYGNIGRTSFGSKAYADYSTSAYNDFTLDANGIANVSNSGISKFSTQLSWDILNDTTGLSWSSTAISMFQHFFADQVGTTNDPKLVVTYTLPMGGYIFISS